MKKPIPQGQEKAVAKKYSPEEMKNKVLSMATEGDLNPVLQELGQNLFPKYIDGDEKKRGEIKKVLDEKLLEAMVALETNTHIAIKETFSPMYRGLVREFCDRLISDYGCTNHAEKALAEIITNAYIRVIDCSRRFNNDLGGPGTSITENKTKYLTMLSKQIDRASRQFLNALIALKQLKAPNIEMNIKTQNAFVAQNQQVNTMRSENPPISTNNETNDPK